MISQSVISDSENLIRRSRFPLGAQLTIADMTDAGREHVLDELRSLVAG